MSLNLSALQNVKQGRTKTTAACPACRETGHDREGNHLAIFPSGAFHCIRCPDETSHNKRIMELAGEKDSPIKTAETRREGGRVFETVEQAAAAVLSQVGRDGYSKLPRTDIYKTADGNHVAAVLRFDKSQNDENGKPPKTFRPFRRVPGGWQMGDPSGLWPLYRLPEIMAHPGTVYLCEGEKAADAGASLGLVCTTTAHGAKSPGKSDMSPLAGRDVVIIRDNDASGEVYANTVAELAHKAGAQSVKIVLLPGLPPKGDIADFIEADDSHTFEELRERVEILAAASDEIPKAPEVAEPEPAALQLDGDAIILPGGPQSYRKTASTVFRRMAETGRYFFRAGTVCEASSDGLRIIRPDGMQTRIEQFGQTYVHVAHKYGYALKPKPPTESDCKAILAAPEAEEHLPPVDMVLAAPMLFRAADGNIIRADGGYCREAKVFVTGKHRAQEADPIEAAATLMDLLRDFDFATTGDKARALSMLVTPALRMGRFIRDGRCPLMIAEADQSQSGKGTILNLLASIYHEQPDIIPLRDGGVGGFDESLQQGLIAGRPFIQFDNLRNKLSSQFLEAVLTAPGPVGCRVPHRGEVPVDPRRFVFLATSNGMESTQDLANRSCLIRLRKKPESYRFHRWTDGGLLEHIEANRSELLAGVHSIVTAWHKAGAKRADVYGHDFRDWHCIVQEIVSMFWPEAGAVIDAEHKETLRRIADPGRGFVRNVALLMRESVTMQAAEIAELAEDHEIPLPFAGAEAGPSERAKAVGRIMARLFRESDCVVLDGVTITRSQSEINRTDGRGLLTVKTYLFEPSGISPTENSFPTGPTGRTTSCESHTFQESTPSSGTNGGQGFYEQTAIRYS